MPKDSLFDVGYEAVSDVLNEHNDAGFEDLADLFAGALHKIVTFAKCADMPDGLIYELVHNAIQCEREMAAEEAAIEAAAQNDVAENVSKSEDALIPNVKDLKN